jgi:DNA-binding NarL/FixJ family response regulator
VAAAVGGRVPSLLGREQDCELLEQLLIDAVAGRSQVIVLRGEPGVGKSALLGQLSDRAVGWHVARAVGVESEMELGYSGLHQLCAPLLDLVDRLPVPQRDALATVFGQIAGAAPERFLVGLATLTLLAEAAERQPLLCIVDDAQWLDSASAQILGFVARRLVVERVTIACAARVGIGDHVLAGLPELAIGGLNESDARALLLRNVYGPLDAAVCDQILAESHGNPLALLELPRTWNTAELAGGFGLPGDRPVVGKIEQSFAHRLQRLPPDTRLLVLTAAAEPLGDVELLHRSCATLGVDMTAASPAVDAGLFRVASRVEFAHPLVRSAAYRSADAADRQRVHRALAEATDGDTDPDRRAWHRARAAAGPGEQVAAELERSAGRARARGGIAAAAAFLQRSVALTVDPAKRAERALAAAQASLQAGRFDEALGLVATAQTGPLDEHQAAVVALVVGQVAFASAHGREAPQLLLNAASQLERLDMDLARETYLSAWVAAVFAGYPAGRNVLVEICEAVDALPPRPGPRRPLDLLLDGLARLISAGHAAATETLQHAAKALTTIPDDDVLRWGWSATAASDAVWDLDATRKIATRHAQLVRDVGAFAQLPLPLAALGNVALWSGDFAGAASHIAETENVATATGSYFPPSIALRLLALRGQETDAEALIASTLRRAPADGQGLAAKNAHWAASVLYNGLGRYKDAAAAAQRVTSDAFEPYVSMWALPELVEAAAHGGDTEVARDALERLIATTHTCCSDFALGVEARCRALLSDSAAADELYRKAIERLRRTPLRPELARAHLLYGEWLRRERRRTDAREQLRVADDMFVMIGMRAFAERARRERLAIGDRVRKRGDESRDQLTPQEEQIARLARDGLSNPEIGAQLFLSARTVEWHLRKVFTKLGISSRRNLRAALSDGARTVVSGQ